MMPGISFADSATRASTVLINAMKNTARAKPFVPLGIEKLNALIKLAEIFQGQIKSKTKLKKTET